MSYIVGIRGLAGSGKTTVADMLCARLPRCIRRPIAHSLKSGLALMGITKQDTPDLYRIAAQVLGTDIVRTSRPNHWVEQFERAAHAPGMDDTVIVVDDIRFPNEADLCHLVVYLEPDFPCGCGDRGGHESEMWNALKAGRIDHTIHNPEGNPHTAVDALLGLVVSGMEG